jgi:hypothetical protein
MQITKLTVFLLAFLIGYIFVPSNKQIAPEIPIDVPEILPVAESAPPVKPETPLETIEWEDDIDSNHKIKLLETGEGFHGDQIQAKSGETWLELFRENDKYHLRSTKIIVRSVYDEMGDDKNQNIRTGKSISVKGKNPTVFLLKNAKMLSEGEVKTVFINQSDEESEQLKNGYRRDFEFNGEVYNLRVENKLSDEEFLGKGSKLILSHNGNEQILNYLKDGCNDCFWYLYWVGDLDRDGKLDFYFDLSWHYNIRDRKLFLSSPAEDGKLVKYSANFWTNGC